MNCIDPVVLARPIGKLTLDFESPTLPGGDQEELWPTATITFDALGLHAAGNFTFFPYDFEPFIRDLSAVHAALFGRCAIESEDGDFSLIVEYKNGGEATVSGHFQPSFEDESALNHRIDTDQSCLSAPLAAFSSLIVNTHKE